MAIDTKPNFSSNKFEQCVGDIMNLSGCTQIYGYFDIESGATITICDNAGTGKVLTSDATGIASWQSAAVQGITAISGGSGMNFSPITTTGTIVLGTPSTITSGSTNSVAGTTHNHAFNAQTFVTGTQGILVDGNNRFYLDETYITDATLPNLYSFSGITSNQSLGVLPSGQTLGMVYITNTGSTTGYFNLGTAPTGDDITPFQTIQVDAGEDVSVTVNMRLSLTENKTIYINSEDWTNVGLNVQWANITYQNASTTINPGDLPIASETTLGAIRIGSGLDIDNDGILSVIGGGTVTGATNLGTGNGQIYSGLTDKDLNFKTLSGGTNISLTTNSNYIGINFTGSSGGGTITGGTNGLSTSGANIVLGGALTGATNICAVNGTSLTFTDNRTTPVGIQYGSDYSANQTCLSIPNVGWVTGGTGGFLGTVTKASAEPSDLRNNQWVKPEPMSTNCFNYTFDNFLDSGSTAISVNLSLEEVFLRYCQSGDYWIKESYDKPLSSGYTWFGDINSKVSEVQVINEWVGSEPALEFPGQKFAYPTQTISVTDVLTCTTTPNYLVTEAIPLNATGNTQIMIIPTGCALVLNRAKLIFLQNATPTSFCVSIGNNYCVNRHLSYDNLVSCVQIDDISLNETYNLELLQQGVSSGIGTAVYFRVGTATSCNLCAHLLIEGFLY